MTTEIPRNAKARRTRPRTSHPHKLKAVHYSLWKFYWKRSRILPEETYNDFQIVAARHFHTDQGTISRRLDVLIEHEAVVLVRPRKRGAHGYWTSKVIRPTEPPDEDAFEAFSVSPLEKSQVDEVIENKAVPTTWESASVEAYSTPISLDDRYEAVSDTGKGVTTTVSDAKTQVDKGVENKATPPLGKSQVVALRDRIVAAHKKLQEYEDAAADSTLKFGNDGGWGRSIATQRDAIARLRQELGGEAHV